MVILLTDGKAGLHSGDKEILSWLRSMHRSKPTLLAVNKCENVGKAAIMVRTPAYASIVMLRTAILCLNTPIKAYKKISIAGLALLAG